MPSIFKLWVLRAYFKLKGKLHKYELMVECVHTFGKSVWYIALSLLMPLKASKSMKI